MDSAHKCISDSVAYYKMVQGTISRYQQTLNDIRCELKILLNQPEMEKIWSPFLTASTILSSHLSTNYDPCSILVCGLGRAGKSSLVNEFLRDEIHLPNDDFLATLRFTVVKYGEKNIVRRVLNREILEEQEMEGSEPPEDFIKGNNEGDRLQDETNIRQHVEIEVDYELLKSGLHIIDTPGLDENKLLNAVFYDLVKDFRPTLVIFVFDAMVGLGENVVRYIDKLLVTLNSMKYNYYVMFAANKINGDWEAKKRDPFYKKFIFDESVVRAKLLENFPNFGENVKVHGTSPHVFEDFRYNELPDDMHHVLKLHQQFEIDIGKNIRQAALALIESTRREVEPLNHDLKSLMSNMHHGTIVKSQELRNKQRAVNEHNFPNRLLNIHETLSKEFVQKFQESWDPSVYEKDLENLSKPHATFGEPVEKSLVECLIDRAVNVIANIVPKIFRLPNPRYECDAYTELCQRYLPMSVSHKYCILELLVTQDKLIRIREECIRIMKVLVDNDFSGVQLDGFIAKLCHASMKLPEEIGKFVKCEMAKEVETLKENVDIWQRTVLTDENQLGDSMNKLNSLINKTAVINLALSYVKQPEPDESWTEIHELQAHFPKVQDGHNWLIHLDTIYRNKDISNFQQTDFTLVHPCLLDYWESRNNVEYEDDVSCSVRIQWKLPSSHCLIDAIRDMNLDEKIRIMECLLNVVKSNMNNPTFHYFCIHSFNIVNDGSSMSLIYNPYLPPLDSAHYKTDVLSDKKKQFIHDCWQVDRRKYRLFRVFLHIYRGSCSVEEINAAMIPLPVNECLSNIFGGDESVCEKVITVFSQLLMLH